MERKNYRMGKETIIEEKLLQDITEFCELNEIEDTTTFINKLLREVYMEFKWLDSSPRHTNKEKVQEEPKKEIEVKKEEPKKNFFGRSNKSDLYGE